MAYSASSASHSHDRGGGGGGGGGGVWSRLVSVFFFTFIFWLILAAAIFLRQGGSLPGDEAYFNIAIARDLQSLDLTLDKNFSDYILPFFVAFVGFFSGNEIAVLILQFLSAALAVIFFTLVLHELELGRKQKILALVLFLISPAVIWIFSTSSKFMIPFTLAIISIYAMLRKNFKVSRIFFIIVSFFGIASTFGAILVKFPFVRKGDGKWFAANILIAALINGVLFYLFPYFPFGGILVTKFFGIFASLSPLGISLFAFALAVIGIIISWREQKTKRSFFSFYIAFILLLLLSLSNTSFTAFLSIHLAILSSIGLVYLFERKWESNLIRNLTLLILTAGLLFSFGSTLYRVNSLDPSQEMLASLKFLKQQEHGMVLSSPYNGFFIKALAEKSVVTDSFRASYKSAENEQALQILQSRNIEFVSSKFRELGMEYVYITPRMRQEIWKADDEGILFILKYGNIFQKIYDKDGIEIWEFIG